MSEHTTTAPLIIPGGGEGFRCRNCTNEHRSNNHVRLYWPAGIDVSLASSSHYASRYAVPLCTTCLNGYYAVCAECESVQVRGSMTGGYCSYHAETCRECDERGNFTRGVCNDCGWGCSRCGVIFPTEVESVYDSRVDGDVCPDCEIAYADYGVRSYGTTRPTKWFGGPLPRNEAGQQQGYYLGFELEIYSDTEDARPIHRWAREHNLEGFFDCKQDSSVEGFEIATMPFTPEFFETMVVDGRWDSFFTMLNANYEQAGNGRHTEPSGHGLHVHVGRVAFARDDVGLAAFCYLLGQDGGKHLERIARRSPTGYSNRVDKPVSTAIVHANSSRRQVKRLSAMGVYPGRNAINLTNGPTIEIRAFRSTRVASELIDAVRLCYVAAAYARHLRSAKGMIGLDPKKLTWNEFCRWSANHHPQAFATLANLEPERRVPVTTGSFEGVYASGDEDEDQSYSNGAGGWQIIDRHGCSDRACCPQNFRQVRPPVGIRAGLAAVDQAVGVALAAAARRRSMEPVAAQVSRQVPDSEAVWTWQALMSNVTIDTGIGTDTPF